MLVLSLQTLIEQAVESFKAHQYTGNILSVEEFLLDENIRKLEDAFDGIFAFLAFHPRADQPIVDYVQAGSMSSDSGRHVLVLFISEAARWPTSVTERSVRAWLELDLATHPSYELMEALFKGSTPPTPPGVAFFSRFTDSLEPVFVSLQGLTTKELVRGRLQTAFSVAARVYSKYGKSPDRFVDHFCIELELQHVPYVRAGRTPLRAWLVRAFHLAWQHKGDVVSVVKLIK